MRSVDVERLDLILHDSRLDLSTLVLDSGRLTIEGEATGAGSVAGVKGAIRFAIKLVIPAVVWVACEDDEAVGEIFVERVSFDAQSGCLRVESSVPGRLLVGTNGGAASVMREPVAVRRWGRWRQIHGGT